jgi:antitoxin (DNA-binding transcriptional repressor) of toxin-antitoxin stability system
VINDVARRHRPTLITRAGRPIVAVVPIDADALEDWILANSPQFVEGLRLADEELKRGETTWLDARGRMLSKRPLRPAKRR